MFQVKKEGSKQNILVTDVQENVCVGLIHCN